jgi:hypothetical protein
MTTRRTMNTSNEPRLTNFMPMRTQAVPLQPQVSNIVVQPTPTKPTMKWGAPAWTFLHTLAALIKESSFQKVRMEVFNIIVKICTNLPCPICSNHAREYFNKLNVNAIKSKQDLIYMLYTFHNEVNARKKYTPFPLSGLDKYQTGNYKAIVNNFMIHYQEKTRNIHLIADEMNRQLNVRAVKSWIIENLHIIDIIE